MRYRDWLAPVDDVLNVWVSPVDSIAAGQPVTRTTGRPINWQSWSPDGRYIMFLNDENGDENLRLFRRRSPQFRAPGSHALCQCPSDADALVAHGS